MASEERRAAARQGAPVEVHREVRTVTRDVVRTVYTPVEHGAAARYLEANTDALVALLRRLAERARLAMAPNRTLTRNYERMRVAQLRPAVAELLAAHDAAVANGLEPFAPPPSTAAPQPASAPAVTEQAPVATTPAEAVGIVLRHPRAVRELLDELAAMAAAGELLDGRHSGTVNAAARLIRALVDSRTLRP